MTPFKISIERATLCNNYYRKVLFTTDTLQLVVMSLLPKEEIGMEKHPHTTQFIRVERGKALAIVGNRRFKLKNGDVIIIPKNKNHNIINTGRGKLKLYTLYSPPEHPKNRAERFKD